MDIILSSHESYSWLISMNGDVRVETREKRAKIIPPQGFDSHGSRATQNYYHCNTMLQANDTFEASYCIKLVNNNKNTKTKEQTKFNHWKFIGYTVYLLYSYIYIMPIQYKIT